MSTVEAIEFRRRREPGLGGSFALALAMHAVLIAMMFVGVRWQSRPPETVTVELWEAPPPPPPPVVEAPKPPPEPPKVAPEPPKPEPKPEIVERAKPKPKPKPEPTKPKPEAKPKPDPKFLKQMQDEAAREQKTLQDQDRAREARETAQRLAAAANKKAVDEWVAKIRDKVHGRLTLPPDLSGNPEAIFDVLLLPTGEVLSVRMRKSSGHKGYDAAIERANLGSSPLPKPDQPSVFRRELELKFRPKDQ